MAHIQDKIVYWTKALAYWQRDDSRLDELVRFNLERVQQHIDLWNAKARALILSTMGV